MNPRIPSVLILAAALSASALSPLFAAPKDTPAIGYWVSSVTETSWDDLLLRTDTRTVFPGSSRSIVLTALGQPMSKLAPDVWVYDGFQPDLNQAVQQGCTILVVTFANDRVENMKFVNRPAIEIFAENLKTKQPGRYASQQSRPETSG